MKNLIIILILLPVSLWAQMPSWRTVNLEPEIDIKNMEADSLGFLWFNDLHALYRFDGNEVIPKFKFDEEKISAFAYQSDLFLIGTSLGRVLKIDPYSNNFEVLQDTIYGEAVTEILYIDKLNYVTVSYGSGIRIIHEGHANKLDVENGLISNEVYDIKYHNKLLYIATDQGIQVLDPEKQNIIQTIGTEEGLSDLVVTHLISHNNKLWYTDYNGNLGYLNHSKQVKNFSPTNKAKVNTLITYDESIYLATDLGLTKFTNGQFQSQYPETGFEKITLAQKDEEGNIWLVNAEGILLKGSLYFQKLHTGFNEIRAFTKVDDRFIIGNQEGLYSFKHGKSLKINEDNITHIIRADKHILVGTFSQGVMVYDTKLNLISQMTDWSGFKDQSVLNLYYQDEHVYVSSLSGVMEFAFDKGQLTPSKSFNDFIGPGYVYTTLLTDGKIYFGTDRKGLIVWDQESQKVENFKTFASSEKIGSVFAITKNKEGEIWFTSDEKGLGFIDNEVPTVMKNQINTADHYTSLITTYNGNLLAVRGSTVDLVDPTSHHTMFFDKELGISHNTSYLNTIHQENKDTYFVHDHDIYKYTAYSSLKIHPEVIIDEVLVNLKPVINEFSFSQDENNIEFNYNGSWLTDPSKLTYQYLLEGFDDDWRTTKDKSISFRKLTPGQYKFRLRASENGQFVDEPEDTYTFEIRKHIYNLWWIRGLGIFLLGFIGWQSIKAREGRKKEKLALEKLNIENQFINLKNQLNPHFLFNAFNTLIGMIEEDSDRSVAFVEGMTDFYRNMLELGKLNLIPLAQEKEILSQYISILKARFNGQLEIKVVIEDNPNQYELPPMTLQLLLENAVKHNIVSTKNPLRVSILQNGNKIIVRNRKTALVQDVKSTKTGLKNIKQRFELMKIKAPEITERDNYFEVIVHLKRHDI